jgi:predicted DNA-binding protein YlxM (UPF0122 family)
MSFSTQINWNQEVTTLASLSAQGFSMSAIAEKYGVSRQRVKQVFQKYKIPQVGLRKNQIDAKILWDLKWGKKEDTGLYEVQRQKFRNKKAQAQQKGQEFSIPFGKLTWPKYCPVLGIELNYFAEKTEEASPSFDKVDPSKGYIEGNVAIISWRANRIKNDGSAEEHRKIALYIENENKEILL